MRAAVRIPLRRTRADAAGRFTAWLGLALAVLVGCIALINTWVDPYGFRPGSRYSVVQTDATRSIKSEMLRQTRTAPDVLIVGSSRGLRMDPEFFREAGGPSAYNAAVPTAGVIDAWAFTRYAADHFDALPELVWVLDVEAFRARTPDEVSGGDERLARWLDGSSQAPVAKAVERLGRNLSMEATRMSVSALRRGPRPQVAKMIRLKTTTGGAGTFAADGQYRPDAREHRRPEAIERGVDLKVTEYRDLIYGDGYDGLDADEIAYGERLLRYANEQGRTPIIVLPPYHPSFVAKMQATEFPERERQVRQLLEDWEETYDIHVLDCLGPDACGVQPTDYYDGVHPTGAANQAVVERIRAQGWLEAGAPPSGRGVPDVGQADVDADVERDQQ